MIVLFSVVATSLCRWDRVDNVCWLFGLEGLGRVKPDLVADRVCGLEEIELERQQVRWPELLPEEHHIHPRSKPLPKEPSIEERRAHELTHLPARSQCETCVAVGEVVVTCLNCRSTTCSWDAGARRS